MVVAALLIAGAIVGGALIKDRSSLRETELQRSLTITGTASREVASDRLKWSLRITRNENASSTLQAASDKVGADIDGVVRKLAEAGIQNPTVSRHPIETHVNSGYGGYYDEYSSSYGSGGASSFTATQTVVIETDQPQKANEVMAKIANELSASGAFIDNNQTEFLYTKRDDLRRELSKEALDDATRQANVLSNNGVSKIVRVDGGSYLTFSPLGGSSYNSYYGGGSDDTTSIQKKAEYTVSITFSLK